MEGTAAKLLATGLAVSDPISLNLRSLNQEERLYRIPLAESRRARAGCAQRRIRADCEAHVCAIRRATVPEVVPRRAMGTIKALYPHQKECQIFR